MRGKINFVVDKNELEYNPDKQRSTYYQFCRFKNSLTGMYQSRKIIFDEIGTILKTYEKEYSQKQIEKFANMHRDNKYKMYSVSEIKYVALPNGHDMAEVQSELLNNLCTRYGYMNVKY